MANDITLEQVELFINLLTGGDIDDDFTMFKQIPLTRHEAFRIVYRLQEEWRRIPDHYEMCECGKMFDSECDGGTRQGDNVKICDICRADYDFCPSCCTLVPLGTVNEDGLCEKCREADDETH